MSMKSLWTAAEEAPGGLSCLTDGGRERGKWIEKSLISFFETEILTSCDRKGVCFQKMKFIFKSYFLFFCR